MKNGIERLYDINVIEYKLKHKSLNKTENIKLAIFLNTKDKQKIARKMKNKNIGNQEIDKVGMASICNMRAKRLQGNLMVPDTIWSSNIGQRENMLE